MRHRFTSDAGFGLATILVTVGCLLTGGAAATGAVVTVLKSYGPQDSKAVQHGPKTVVPPEQVLNYGG